MKGWICLINEFYHDQFTIPQDERFVSSYACVLLYPYFGKCTGMHAFLNHVQLTIFPHL